MKVLFLLLGTIALILTLPEANAVPIADELAFPLHHTEPARKTDYLKRLCDKICPHAEAQPKKRSVEEPVMTELAALYDEIKKTCHC